MNNNYHALSLIFVWNVITNVICSVCVGVFVYSKFENESAIYAIVIGSIFGTSILLRKAVR